MLNGSETAGGKGFSPASLIVQPLWDSLDQAIIVTDRNLEAPGPIIRYVNPAFTRLTGYRPEEAIGRSPRFLQCPRTDRAVAHGLKDDLLRAGEARATLVNRRKDGNEYWCSLVVTALLGPDGDADHFICAAHLHGDGIRYASQEHEQLLTLIEDLEERHDATEAVVGHQRTELSNLGVRYRAALDRIDALFEQTTLRERALDLRNIEVARSETELRATLEELRAMEEELRISFAEVEEANATLMRLNESLRASQAANADKLRLLATASHDLRQPVMSLGLFLEVLRHRVGPNEHSIMGALMAAHLSMRTLLDGMLDTARLDAGALTPEIGPVSMDVLLEGIACEFALQAEMRGVRFRVVSCSCEVVSDPQLLERILRNLIGNALKYTERGGILLGCRRSGDRLRIEVWDSGPGIPKQSQELIFEEFRQLDNPNHDQRRGVGLGLSIVARLAKQLGHEIGLHSRLGQGSVFSLTVPMHAHCAPRSRTKRLKSEVAP
ncbi:PAS domain-containing sensor histidine kinase [Azospirillum doebereinerae]